MKQDSVTLNHRNVVNIYIVCEISKNINISDYPTLKHCLFIAVSLTKNSDIDKYEYFEYGIWLDRHGSFSFNNGIGRNVTIFGVDMSLSIYVDNKGKDILIFGKGPTQGLGEHSLTAETAEIFLVNFKERNKSFRLSLHYNEWNSYLFVIGKEIHKFKANHSEIVATPLSLQKISKDSSIYNGKKTGLNRYVYDFSVDYDAIAVDDILDIHSYLMKKNDIV